MAEGPSSGAPEQREGPRDEGGRPPTSPPPPPSPSPAAARTAESPPPPAATEAAKSSSHDPAVSSSSAPSAGAAGENSGPQTLAITVSVLPNSDLGPDGAGGGAECRRSFSQLLAGAMASPLGSSIAMPIVAVPVDAVRIPVVAVPCFLAPAALLDSSGFTGQFAMTHQAVLATVTAQAQIQLQSSYAPSPTIPTIVPVPTQQSPPSASEDNVLSPEAEQQPSSDQKLRPAPVVLKTTLGDKFNWRKYGQKQVKSSERSRSYYRCTQAHCSAKKKVECCQDGRVIEVIYKGEHNHDPPQKVKCSKERRRQSIAPSGDNESLAFEGGEANESLPSQSKMEQDSGSDTPEQQLHCSSDCEADAGIKTEEDLDEEPDLKRRLTERPLASPSPRFKSVKEPKVVVQKTSDGGPSSDGYRWRKYGQKFVKGNPNPRSYYKCTQIGCPARKHVERDSEDAKAIIIQYEGKHNHDLPTSKSGNDPPATPLLIAAAAAAAIDADGCLPTSVKKSPRTRPQRDVDLKMASEKASELGGDKALESAQALLSIGFKSASEEDGRRDGSDVNPHPLVVSVQNS